MGVLEYSQRSIIFRKGRRWRPQLRTQDAYKVFRADGRSHEQATADAAARIQRQGAPKPRLNRVRGLSQARENHDIYRSRLRGFAEDN